MQSSIDPVYKGLGKRDENKAGDIASLCNEIEQLAVQSGESIDSFESKRPSPTFTGFLEHLGGTFRSNYFLPE